MNEIVVLAIDRAEAPIGDAVRKLEQEKSLKIKAYMLVNIDFKNSPAYRGDETNGLFEEIECDFSKTSELNTALQKIGTKNLVIHCRMEEAIKDLQKIIPLLPIETKVQPVKALKTSTEKFLMREAIAKKYPALCPKYIRLFSHEEYDPALIKEFTFPVIIKPNGLHSSFFVMKCSNEKELDAALAKAFHGLKSVYEREYGTGVPSLLIEEFIDGKMYSVDVYVTEKNKVYFLPPVRVVVAAEVGLDGYYGYQYDLPSDLSEQEINSLNEACLKAIDAVELAYSVVHIELYNTENGWKIIELAPRIGGYRQDLYWEAYGIDHYYNDLLLHLGEHPRTTPIWQKYASGLTIYAESEGEITAINGIEDTKKLESVVSVGLDTSIGRTARFNSNGGQLLAIVILSNKSIELLKSDNAKVRKLIRFEVASN